ncbi:MAG: 4-(cytidine 5'-diphospho)-2-C-methyl-D-erythritol kinase [Bacteroidales bacterium]|nr:4-(cytidine 5'-diphospho)-2-C-methyl-D-erythritol kinase [Bacteroidales bacterium]
MIVFPRAKINIGLTIVRKRDDGFHDIETIFYPVGLTDALEFIVPAKPGSADRLTVTGTGAGCATADNLVVRAAGLMREKYKFPCLKIHLHKMIPPGSGLGGGSSDASSMLMLLNRYFCLRANEQELLTLALMLGSDCPFFIKGTPVLAIGRGELFTPLPCFLNGYYIVIVRENIHISTPLAYANSKPRGSSSGLKELIKAPLEKWRDSIANDFEEYAFREHPRLQDLKQGMYEAGALFSSMSGSGSAIFGIFSKEPVSPPRGNIIWQGWL